jgi:hypothetical protein
MPLYDPKSGGCRDGLHADGVNRNQGAESSLVWLLSLLHFHELRSRQIALEAEAAADGVSQRRSIRHVQ